ncbi:VPEID-CTERM sorting domain-containing protein [Methylobacter svalbardensis]|uniref:VPEID-CTERM sorting domain-containing protein n=1 Tax=Methylobacter svalbardensis TaxID=3080016 RepID=UPI0030EF720C
MKIQQIVLAGVTVMLLTTSSVWAAPGGVKGANPDAPGQVRHAQAKAPEIDAASGTSAIALLTGVLLLAGEKSRSRRS